MNLEYELKTELRQEMNNEYVINVTKEKIILAFENTPFELFKEFIPRPKFYGEKEWTTKYIKRMKYISDELKEDIAILTTLITMVEQNYYCLWQPWRTPSTNIDSSFFMSDFIKESYKDMGKEAKRINKEEIADANPELLKHYYERLYGYFLAKRMVNAVDNVYLRCTLHGYPICSRLNSNSGQLWLRYNNVSVRGSRRVKMWDTFVTKNNFYSRRATPGKFYNLHPFSGRVLDSLECDEDRVPYLLRKKGMSNDMCEYLEAIHPHISNATACLGGWESKLINVASKGYSELFFKAIRGFLCTWSRQSPFWNINHQYYKTYTLHDPKKKKNVKVHWSPVDSMFLTKNHPSLFSDGARYREICAKILCSERLENGIYTTATVQKLKRIIRDAQRLQNGAELLSKLHAIPYRYGDDEKENVKVDKNPYLALRDLIRNSFIFSLPKRSSTSRRTVSLDRKKSNIEFKAVSQNVMHRTNMIADGLWYHILEKMDFKDVMKYDRLVWETKYLTLKEFEIRYIDKWMRWREGLSEEDLMMHDYTRSQEEDILTLQLMMNPEFTVKQISEWKKQSISSTLDRVNKEKEEYVNELTHMSNYPEQGQLFSG